MRVLLIVPSINPCAGGVEKVSFILAKYFREHDIIPFAYSCVLNEASERCPYERVYCKGSSMKDIVEREKIDVVLNQLSFDGKILNQLRFIPLRVKIISCFHGAPTFYRDNIRIQLRTRKNKILFLRNLMKGILLPFYDPYKNIFQEVYKISKYFVLLSNSFVQPFSKTYKIKDLSRFSAIGNPLTFSYRSISVNKKKQVLIVSRLSDSVKRISLLVRVWKEIEKQENFKDWNLIIVGDGPDYTYIKNIIEQLNLNHCFLLGQKNEVEIYYEESAIFLMASSHEGWGLTLTEAMQKKCVPIAFDTYLSLHEIIDDGKTGFIIPEGSVKTYQRTLEILMSDETLRSKMASCAFSAMEKYSAEKVCSKWLELLKK